MAHSNGHDSWLNGNHASSPPSALAAAGSAGASRVVLASSSSSRLTQKLPILYKQHKRRLSAVSSPPKTLSASLLTSYLDTLPASLDSCSVPLPNLSAYPIRELQDEVRSWGFRPPDNRAALMSTLERIWPALVQRRRELDSDNGIVNVSHSDDEEIIRLAQHQSGDCLARDPDDHENTISSDASVTSDPSEDEPLPLTGQPALLSPPASSLLYQSITSDEQLYHRILLMEPIPFEEVWSLVQRDVVDSLGGNARATLQLAFVDGDTSANDVNITFADDDDDDDDSDTPLAITAKRSIAARKTSQPKRAKSKGNKRQKAKRSSRSGTQGIKGRLTAEVKAWLDLRGITWYEGELTGPRSRHS